jgi:2-phospho-L-lactate guanylyltransferase
MNIWAIIPVKPLHDSKSRISHILTGEERAKLTSYLMGRTIDVLGEVLAISRTLVVSRDPAALKIARQHGASTYGETEKQDLNLALTRASHIAAAQKANSVLVLPSDLPLLTVDDVEMMVNMSSPAVRDGNNGYQFAGRYMAICPDQSAEGTNALLISPPTGFSFQYGPGSFHRHLAEAERLGMSKRIVHAQGIEFDLDTEGDWEAYQALESQSILSMIP